MPALLRALLGLLVVCGAALGSMTPQEEALLRWVETRGGEVHFTLGRPCPTCARGAVASRAFRRGDLVALVPRNTTIPLTSGKIPEAAYDLLQLLAMEPAYRRTFAPYLASLPSPGEVLSAGVMGEEELRLLQTPELQRLVQNRQAELARLLQLEGPGPAGVTLEQLQHMTSVVRTRNFKLLRRQRLVPAFDMLNHSDEPNVRYSDGANGTDCVVMRAKRPIAQGEVLTDRYTKDALRRPDFSLYHYGFVQEAERPLLCITDLPTYTASKPWKKPEGSDERYLPPAAGGWLARYILRREHSRLSGLLAQMPTTEQQDETLLLSGELQGWKQRVVVSFRLQRKRALRLALEHLERAWDGEHARTSSSSSGSNLLAGAAAACVQAARDASASAGGSSPLERPSSGATAAQEAAAAAVAAAAAARVCAWRASAGATSAAGVGSRVAGVLARLAEPAAALWYCLKFRGQLLGQLQGLVQPGAVAMLAYVGGALFIMRGHLRKFSQV